MASLADIRAGLATNLSTIPGSQVSAYVLANPTPPIIWVRPAPDTSIEYHRAMGELTDWTVQIQAFVGDTTDIGAQKLLDRYLETTGTHSVKAAAESDQTLGGAATAVTVRECSGYTEYARTDGTTALGCEWTVQVQTET